MNSDDHDKKCKKLRPRVYVVLARIDCRTSRTEKPKHDNDAQKQKKLSPQLDVALRVGRILMVTTGGNDEVVLSSGVPARVHAGGKRRLLI
jgi:hypothetical protein